MLTMNAYDPMVSLPMGTMAGTMAESPTDYNAVLSPVDQVQSPANFDIKPFHRYDPLILPGCMTIPMIEA